MSNDRPTAIETVAFVALIGAATAFVWCFRFLPMDDYPNWVLQGQVLAQLAKGHPLPGYSLYGYPVPNAFSTVVMGLLDLVLSPEAAGKICLTLCILGFALGSYYLVGAFTRGATTFLSYVPLCYVFSRNLWKGELNFSFGLAVLLFALGYVLRRTGRLRAVSGWAVLGFSLLLFFSHAVAFYVWAAFLALLFVVHRREFPLGRVLLGVSPALILMAVYTVMHMRDFPTRHAALPLSIWLQREAVPLQVFSVITFFVPFVWHYPRPLLELARAVNLAAVLGVLALVVIWLRHWLSVLRAGRAPGGPSAVMFYMPLALLAAFVVVPSEYVTGIYDFNERFLYPAVWLIFASLAAGFARLLPLKTARALKALTMVLVALLLGFQYVHVGRVARQLAGIYEDLRQTAQGEDVQFIPECCFNFEGQCRLPPKQLLLPGRVPLLGFHSWLSLENHTSAGILTTGLFSYRETRDLPAVGSVTDLRNLSRVPSKMVILGSTEGNRFIAGLLADRYDVTLSKPYLTVLSKKADLEPNPVSIPPSHRCGTHHYPHSVTGHRGCLVVSAEPDIVIFHIAARSSKR